MTTTPRLGIPLVPASSAQKHIFVNEALIYLDTVSGIITVQSRIQTAPLGTEADGDVFIVASPATGEWETWENDIALKLDGVWRRVPAFVGMFASVVDEANDFYHFTGTVWETLERGAPGYSGFDFSWETTSVTTVDQGNGKVWLDNATPASATELAISDLTQGAKDITDWIATFDDSDSDPRGYLIIRKVGAVDRMVFAVTSARVDETGWSRFSITPVLVETFADGDLIDVTFYRTGDAGEDGSSRLYGTSTTSLALSVGSKALTTQANRVWVVGQRLVLASDDLTKRLEGVITAHDSGTGALTVDVDYVEGSGTHADWNISFGGTRGSKGDDFEPDAIAEDDAERDLLYGNQVSGYAVIVNNPEPPYDSGPHIFFLTVPDVSTPEWSAGVPFGIIDVSLFERLTGTWNGSDTDITFSDNIDDINRVMLFEDGVYQVPGTDFTASGPTITMVSARPSGVNWSATYLGAIPAQGIAGRSGVPYSFNSSTSTGADPGLSKFTMNNASPASVTAIAFNDTDSNGADREAHLLSLPIGTQLELRGYLDPSAFAIYQISAAVSDQTGYVRHTVTYVSHADAFSNNEAVDVIIRVPGVQGPQGDNFNVDAVGTFAGRSAHDGEAAGFAYLSTDGDGGSITTAVIFFKDSATSGDWSAAVEFQGPIGPAGPQGDQGIQGPEGAARLHGRYVFDSNTTTAADPGTGEFRVNNVTLASVTRISFSDIDDDARDISAFILAMDDGGSSTHRGYITIHKKDDPSVFAFFNVTGSTVDGSGYSELTVSFIAGAGTWTVGDEFDFLFVRTGATGATGPVHGPIWNWSTTTTEADPSSGNFRFNNATLLSVTELYFNDVQLSTGGSTDMSAWFATFDDIAGVPLGYLYGKDITSNARWFVFRVNAIVDRTGWWELQGVMVAGGSAMSNGQDFAFEFVPTGATGIAGGVTSVNGDSGPAVTLDAAEIGFTPTGNIAASHVQGALAELDTEKIAAALLTTRGDLIRRGASAPERVGLGAAAFVLGSDGTDAVWVRARGKRTVNLLTAGMVKRTTNGATPYQFEEGATNDTMVAGYEFSGATAQAIQIAFPLPLSYDEAVGLTFKFYGIPAATAGTGNIVWQVRAKYVRDGDSVDGAWGTVVGVTDAFLADQQQHISPETGAVTPGGTFAAECMLYVELIRDPAHANDTYTQNFVLQAARMKYSEKAMTDD